MENKREDMSANAGEKKMSEGVASPIKKKKGKSEKKRFGDKNIIVALVALVVAFVVFIVFLTMENHIVNKVDTKGVVVAIEDVPKGLYLTQENMYSYFTVEQRAIDELPANVCSSGHEMVGKVTLHEISKKQVITKNDVTQKDFYAGIEDPVEISIEVSKIGQAVGGILRAGDYINIGHIVEVPEESYDLESDDVAMDDVPEVSEAEDNKQTEESEKKEEEESLESEDLLPGEELEVVADMIYSSTGNFGYYSIAENVPVTAVFNSAGQGTSELEAEGTVQVATIINIAIPRSKEAIINLALEEGTIRLSRVESSGAVQEETAEEVLKSETEADSLQLESEIEGDTIESVEESEEVSQVSEENSQDSSKESSEITDSTEENDTNPPEESDGNLESSIEDSAVG